MNKLVNWELLLKELWIKYFLKSQKYNKLCSYEFNEMVNDIKSKYEEEYREQEEILIEHWALINMFLLIIIIKI